MSKYNPRRLKPKNHHITKRTVKRAVALTLCVSMVASLITFVLPTRAAAATNPVKLENLYVREADENTMDTYVQASLGGLIYLQEGVDGVSTPTVRNNFGTRFAGEIWADKSVFAQYQNVIAQIRPFEAGHIYDPDKIVDTVYQNNNGTWTVLADSAKVKTSELQRALDTLAYWGVTAADCGVADIDTALRNGTLTAAQAGALNDAINKEISDRVADGRLTYSYTHDGDFYFDGVKGVLQLGRDTDGVPNGTTIELPETSDFLHVFSVLASSEVKNDEIPTPLDVVFILDTSASMSSTGEGGIYNTTPVTHPNDDVNNNARLEYAAEALNNAFEALMEGKGNEYNRVALVTYDLEAREVMSLGRYEPTTVERTQQQSGSYRNGQKRYFTIAQAGEYDDRFPQLTFEWDDDVYLKYWYDEYLTAQNGGWRQNRGGNIDIGGLDDDWKVIEINAKPEGNEKISNTDADLFPEVDAIGDAYHYMYTQGGTATATGILRGMEILAKEQNTTVKLYRDNTTGKLTDVAAGNTFVTELQRRPIVIILSDGQPNQEIAYQNWWSGDGELSYPPYGQLSSIPLLSAATAAYQKKRINENYFGDVNGSNGEETAVYTYGFLLDELSNLTNRAYAYATMNPSVLYSGEIVNNDQTFLNAQNTAKAYFDDYLYYYNQNDFTNRDGDGNREQTVITTGDYGQAYTMVHPSGDLAKYDARTPEDLSYPTEFFNVDRPEDLPDIFANLIETITDTPYQPIGGTNSAGVGDAVTYSDPIGDYMTVDSVTDLTLFGHHYTLAAVDANGNIAATAAAAELNYDAAVTLAPALLDTTASLEKQANTTYTVYRITHEDGRPIGTDTKRWNRSFVAEETVNQITDPDELQKLRDQYQFDLLTDIQIWVENTGEWRDSGVGDYIVEDGYSESLYVNISAKAIPVQIATVTLQSDDYASGYETNLGAPEVSTPLRIFYDVSLDTDYLRYYAAGVAKEKRNASGVALTSISTEYLEKNTSYYSTNIQDGNGTYIGDGFYDEVKATDPGARRMVAFYSNYFTDSSYDEFVVMSDKNKSSRGNAAVSFAPSTDNDFYRFQKYRTLYLIPGSFGLEERPAEIDLGDLSGTSGVKYYVEFTGTGAGKEYTGRIAAVPKNDDGSYTAPSDTGGSRYEPLDPTDYEHLLVLLNAYRANMDWDGNPTTAPSGGISNEGFEGNTTTPASRKAPYWYFGDCEFVDEGVISSDKIHATIAERDDDETSGKLHKELEQNLLDAGLIKTEGDGDTTFNLPKIHAKNWYYIMREYYYPVYDATGELDHTEVHYIAIARKGDELGSGVGTQTNEFVCWYNLNTKEVDEEHFDSRNTQNNGYGKPEFRDANGDGIDDNTGSSWYLAAMKGGLRVGSMANFAGVKNYDIREGVSEGVFSSTDEKINLSNVTNTAKTYFLPTISTYVPTTSNEPGISAAAEISVVVNAYLGNNGRILVDDSTLVVTKTVNTVANDTNSGQKSTEQFEMTVRIENFYGVRGAVLITRDEFNRELWRRRFDTIDVLTNNQKLLLGDNSNLALVDGDGQRVVLGDDGNYYLALKGSNGEVIKAATDENGKPKTENGKYVEDAINGILVPSTKQVTDVYYVYVGSNLRSGLYNDKTLRVFKADVDENEAAGVVDLTSGDLYGNESLRGGRNYYLTQEQYDALDEETKAKGTLVEEGGNDSDGYGSRFVFHIINEATSSYRAGDREFWINKVYLIPIGEVSSSWSWPTGHEKTWEPDHVFDTTNKDGENGYGHDGDWRTGYEQEDDDTELIAAGYKLLSQFKVAHIRAEDEEGATTATELASNNGFYIESEFLTTAVSFVDSGNGYGEATFWLRDGQGLGFNNIDTGAWYTVTERITDDQNREGIRFQQVEHVQDSGQRTRYVYDDSSPLKNNNGANPREVRGLGTDLVCTQPAVDNVGVVWGYRNADASGGYRDNSGEINSDSEDFRPGKYYYWWDSKHFADPALETTANFATANYYTISGDTSLEEEAVHYVNFLPDIVKLELTPGLNGDITEDKGDGVYVGSYITYAIRWENYDYNTQGGALVPATVIIRDPLDDGVDFVSASFSPYHGNMADKDDIKDAEGSVLIPGWHFDERVYLKEYQIVANTLLDVTKGGLKEGADDTEHLYEKWITDQDLFLYANMDGNGNPDQLYDATTIPRLDAEKGEMMKVSLKYDAKNHEVIWTIDAAPAGTYGYVELTVQVNSGAMRDWDIDENGSITSDDNASDGEVVDRAGIQVGNNPERFTNRVWNPTGDPHKTETNPGEGIQVAEWQPVEYSIEWTNTKNDFADIIIEDRLDPGVNFYWAGIKGDDFTDKNGVFHDGGEAKIYPDDLEAPAPYESYYAPPSGNESPAPTEPPTLTGDQGETPTEEKTGTEIQPGIIDVILPDRIFGFAQSVLSLNNALDASQSAGSLNTVSKLAAVSTLSGVAGDEIPMTSSCDGKPYAIIGDEVTYAIDLSGLSELLKDPVGDGDTDAENRTVTITDQLDPGVDFVRAENGGVYDKNSHTVTWTWEIADDSENTKMPSAVTLTVKINENAPKDYSYNEETGEITGGDSTEDDGGMVVNMARIEITATITAEPEDDGQEPPETEEITNTLYTEKVTTAVAQKPRMTGATEDGSKPKVGDMITYTISWHNDAIDSQGDMLPRTVTITDVLDPGVDFVEASFEVIKLNAGSGSVANGSDADGSITVSYDKSSHTVTWVLENRAADDTGTVTLTVKVNDNAPKGYYYTASGAITGGSGTDDGVVNMAKVTVVDGSTQYTNEVKTATKAKPTKEIVSQDPNNRIGSEIGYKITWTNDAVDPETKQPTASKVTITDVLDPGVTFVGFGQQSANMKLTGVDEENGTAVVTWTWTDTDGNVIGTITVTCEGYVGGSSDGNIEPDEGDNEDNGPAELYRSYSRFTVKWELFEQAGGTEGEVYLTVRVNGKFKEGWQYTEDGTLTNDSGEDSQVVNMAKVTVDKGSTQSTNVVKTPITVDDPLPKSFKGHTGYQVLSTTATIYLEIRENGEVVRTEPVEVTITYDPDTRIIQWKLEGVPALYQGKVTFAVIVNENADYEWVYKDKDEDDDNWDNLEDTVGSEKDNRIRNQARIKIDNDSWQYTNTIENPTSPEKTEATPGNGKGVEVGQRITYHITWMNDAVDDDNQPAMSTVTIIDKLDPGVTFIDEAGFMTLGANNQYVPGSQPTGCTVVYDKDTHTVTWTLPNRPARATGMVYLIVEVNEKAYDNWQYKDNEELSPDGEGDADKGELYPGAGKDNEVVNKARVQVNNGSNQFTDVVRNPLTPLGNLTVTKTVTGTAGETGKDFHFRVQLSDTSINGVYGEMTFTNGEASFTLKHNESKTATGLPAGVGYTVTETDANQDGYTTSSSGSSGSIPANGTATAAFANHRDDTPTTPPVETTPPPSETTPPPSETTPPPSESVPPSETLPPSESVPPSETLPPDIPQTGDESQLGLWLTLLGLSVAGLFASLVYTVRKIKSKGKDQM